jgi:hypothetical protein
MAGDRMRYHHLGLIADSPRTGVDDLEAALEGRTVIIAANSPSPGVRAAFIEVDGAPVEFLQFEEGDPRSILRS